MDSTVSTSLHSITGDYFTKPILAMFYVSLSFPPRTSLADAGFEETLLKHLVNIIIVAGGETRRRAMLCFCILRATDDSDLTLDMNSFNQLKGKFVEVKPMREMWELVMPETSDSLRGRETTPTLKKLLQLDRIKNALREDDHSWALLTLDKALDPQITLRFEFPSAARTSRLKLIAERIPLQT